jgi:hypothetical protein
MSRRKKNRSWVPDGGLTPRLTVGRNVTSTSNGSGLVYSRSLPSNWLIFFVESHFICKLYMYI